MDNMLPVFAFLYMGCYISTSFEENTIGVNVFLIISSCAMKVPTFLTYLF